MAQKATRVEAVRAHVDLAEAYLDRLGGTENAIAAPPASSKTRVPLLSNGASSLAEEQAQQQAESRARSPITPAMPLLRN